MINCISCGIRVAEAAKQCPNCGQPWPKDGVHPILKFLLLVYKPILGTLLVVCVYLILSALGLLKFAFSILAFAIISVLCGIPFFMVPMIAMIICKIHPPTYESFWKLWVLHGQNVLSMCLLAGIATAIYLFYVTNTTLW